ncbi:MAG: D-2-hydroxyacid dehydrogenase family protein [Proteobacteria bacterium]|nr:D-2-hydroxyacid dehydrogenase family protein [Pseudomonadota bacterium]MYJ94747.1 D-2-hydroxyacid dehydrogenase family protein [Pseudomonadota bacterium]
MKRLAIIDDYQNVALAMTDWSPLADDVSISVFNDHLEDENALVERLRDFEIICVMRERTPFPESLLKRLPNLEHLFTPGMVNASIDVAAARRQGVVVSGSPILPHPTAELTWGLIVALARRITAEQRALQSGNWQTTLGEGLYGKTLGIIGLGRLGSQVARVGHTFGMTVIAWSPNLTPERCAGTPAEFAEKEELLTRSDVVTIHMRLADSTRALISRREFELMKCSACLINTSRGPIVDERALVEALEAGAIGGAGLDVFDVEPLPLDHPLRRTPNTVITPHVGFVTVENYRIFFRTAVENIRAWLDGRSINTLG